MRNLVAAAWKLEIRRQMAFALLVIAAVGAVQVGVAFALPPLAIGVATAVILDGAIAFLRTKHLSFPISALITGLIVGLVLSPDEAWYVIAAAAAIGIAAKHVVRLRGRHLFNPANIGLLSAVLIFDARPSWWGSGTVWLVVLLGTLIAVRFKRLHLVLSFTVLQAIVLAGWYAAQGAPPQNALLLINPFFVLVMLVEPKTSPLTERGRVVFGALAAIACSTFLLTLPLYDPSILGLTLANAFVPFINAWGRSVTPSR